MLIGLMVSAGCGTFCGRRDGGMVHHVVICWLKERGNVEARDKLIAVSKQFESIPGVVSVKAGRVLPSDRAVVDSSYDVAVLINFSSEEALHAYQKNPIHQKAMREVLMPLAEKITIYDFIE